MAEIPVNFLLEKLHSILVAEAQLLGGIRPAIEEIMQKLEMMKAFLKDADRKRDSSETIKTWVNQVRRAAYDMEDVIDEFVLRHGTRSHESDGILNSLRTLLCTMKQLPAKHNLAKRIQEIKSKITEMERNRHEYDIERIQEDESLVNETIRWKGYEEDVVGLEDDVDLLTEKLVGMTGEDRETCPTFVSVVGMGGLGKTTLVRKVYKNVEARFDCSAWVSVSQSFTTKDLLKTMLKDFCKTKKQTSFKEGDFRKIKKQSSFREGDERAPLSKEDIDKMSVDDLKMEVQKYLEGKKFVLVLDDVWERGVCDCLKLVLPENSSGSKIMITTRNKKVASALETPENSNFIHELKTLSEDVAMTLLCRKALPRNSTLPSELEEVCKSMLQRCGGLPLAIAALGGILCKKKSLAEWKKVNENLRYRLDNDCAPSDSITRILKLSYDDLPFHLKPCFLYCGLFPEDHLIRRNKLIRLWVAEGFIKESGGKRTMEDVGEEYMMQLIGRSMLQIGDTNVDGSKVKSCKIHDLMRDLAISISREEEFLFDKQNENVMKKGRRMCVVGHNEEEISIGNHHMRSLLFFDMKSRNLISTLGRFSLLRVLDLEDAGINKLPEQITRLLHLRYLSLRENGDLKHLPRSIGRLINLQTLDIRGTGINKLPNGIVRLRNLRHLCMSDTIVPRGNLTHDPFPSLSSLPSLLRLELYGLNNIKRLQCGPQGFPKLQRLLLIGMEGLESVRLEEGSMPSLKHLEIGFCDKLQMVPQGIEHLQLLQELLIIDMPEDFIQRLKEGGEDRPRVRRIPLVTRRDWDLENKGYVTKVLSQ